MGVRVLGERGAGGGGIKWVKRGEDRRGQGRLWKWRYIGVDLIFQRDFRVMANQKKKKWVGLGFGRWKSFPEEAGPQVRK